jgi:hypothetical protein
MLTVPNTIVSEADFLNKLIMASQIMIQMTILAFVDGLSIVGMYREKPICGRLSLHLPSRAASKQ